MQVQITISIALPEDGTKPNVNISQSESDEAKIGNTNVNITPQKNPQLSEEDNQAVAIEIWERLQEFARASGISTHTDETAEKLEAPTLADGDAPHDFDNEITPEEKQRLRKLELPDKKCAGCERIFSPRSRHQKFHDSQCKNHFYHEKERAKKESAKAAVVKKVPTEKPAVPKAVEVKPVKGKVTRIPDVAVSKDGFYQAQLRKAARKSKQYQPYLSPQDIADLNQA